jgi:hypothetical protein
MVAMFVVCSAAVHAADLQWGGSLSLSGQEHGCLCDDRGCLGASCWQWVVGHRFDLVAQKGVWQRRLGGALPGLSLVLPKVITRSNSFRVHLQI